MASGKQRWWCAALLAVAAAEALAADPTILNKEMGVDPSKELAETRLFEDLVVAPIPISNPTIGTGLAVVVMPFYHVAAGTRLNTAVTGRDLERELGRGRRAVHAAARRRRENRRLPRLRGPALQVLRRPAQAPG
jgi:hypothetical protein